MRDLRALPKAHLHLHLELGMRPSTLAELAERAGMPVPQVHGYGSFAAFNDMCVGATAVLRTRADWSRLADEICEDAVADGAVYIEPSFWPLQPPYAEHLGDARTMWGIVLEAFADASSRHGLSVRFMAPLDRVLDDPPTAMALAELAIELMPTDDGVGVVSFGLHNDEVGHPPGDFVEPFRVAREAGLQITPHAGELEHGRFVQDSLDLLGAHRIQHGVRAFEVPGLVDRLAVEQVCLDVCPTSNIMLSVFPSFAEHTLPRLVAAGVPVSVNADDPLLFDTGLLDEYEVCRREFGFSDEQLAAIARDSIRFGNAPQAVKAAALTGIDAWLASAP